jgi:hypothetical protein
LEEEKEEPAAETDMHVLDLQLTLEQNGGERSAHGLIDRSLNKLRGANGHDD